jgi:DNA-binding SARP family transcriptional activator
MEVGVLGPLTVSIDGCNVPLERPKERALLAALVFHRGHAVDRDYLADAIWGATPPRAFAAAMRAHVRRLRAVLGHGAIETHALGYLCPATTTLDADRLQDAVRADGEPDERAGLLECALALWRGRPYADLGDWELVEPERQRLYELRAQAQVDCAAARLEVSHAPSLVPTLEELVREAPLDERRWELLILALHRSGRRVDALRAFQRAREKLVAAGLDPGRRLIELDRAIARDGADLAEPDRAHSAPWPTVAQQLRAADDARRAGRDTDAQRILKGLEAQARRSRDPAVLAEAAIALSAEGGVSGLNPDTHVLRLLDEALARLPAAPTCLRSRALARAAVAGSSNRDPDLVRAQGREALSIARLPGDNKTLRTALYARLATEQDPASLGECHDLASELLATAGDDRSVRVLALCALARLSARRADLDSAARFARAAAEPAQSCPPDVVLATLWYALFRATLTGDLQAARRAAATCDHVARRAFTDPEAALGMVTAVDLMLATVFAQGPRRRPPSVRLDEITWPQPNLGHLAHAATALELARAGDHDAARALLEPVTHETLTNLTRDGYWPGVVWSVSAVTHILADTERAAALYTELAPFHGQLLIDPAGIFLGCTDHHLWLLADTCQRSDKTRQHRDHATATYTRMNATWWSTQLDSPTDHPVTNC